MFAIKREQQIGNFVPGLAIEVAGGLIGEQNGRAPVKGPGQRHPLLFAAGELRRQVVQAFAKSQLLKQRAGIALHPVQRFAQHRYFPAAAIVEAGEDRQQGRFTGTRLADQGDGLPRFDNQLNSGKDGELMLPLTDGLLKMMNFKYVFRWHVPFLLLFLFTCRAMAADTLLILGDSLSAGYRMAANAAWPALLNEQWQAKTPVVNASISGDTSQQGLARLPALLKQHQPRWVLVELGGNDGLRGFPPQQTEQTLRTIIKDIKAANAEPLLMQIHLPANYGRRYNEAFGAIYPALAKEFAIPLLPFFMEEVYLKPQWMQDDGIHPNRDAQPFIADWMAKRLAPLVNHDS
ncbi:multifunctional acyl-CoA thioesterase I and protease I and lysophospholipase L1 [Klebsiella pneumoniae]|nr:multifunctional acyl-CoA thioesterase I and protease I and lysophospholipase L1 [Klebsiella pneumoniae]VUG87783.1 multifunctional acyl-CoA thioesterase I and protease I and lysophospholipase L1 [Klebsiella pneumoniae]